MPSISVIIPCYRSGSTLMRCLDSLRRQTFSDFEVILIDSTPDDDSASQIAVRYPGVVYYHHGERLGAHAARNLGAGMAVGELLVFTDPDMAADACWLEYLAGAHREGRTVVAGGVGCPTGYWNNAVHLVKYGWWLPGGEVATRPQLASGNFSLGRGLFEKTRGFPCRYWAGDTELSLRLKEMGHSLWLLPQAVTTHLDAATPSQFLQERFDRGCDHGRARIVRLGWRRAECAQRLLATPAVPVLMLARSARYAADSRRSLAWLGAFPVIAAGVLAWTLGEARAHWEGLWER